MPSVVHFEAHLMIVIRNGQPLSLDSFIDYLHRTDKIVVFVSLGNNISNNINKVAIGLPNISIALTEAEPEWMQSRIISFQ